MPLIIEEIINESIVVGVWHCIESLGELEADIKLPDHDQLELKKTSLHKRKIEKTIARMLVKELYEKHFNLEYKGLKKLTTGKPIIVDSDKEISISHCENYLCVLISTKDKAGIDLQNVNDKIQRVAPRIFSEDELEQIGTNKMLLARAWSAKEAMFKYYEKGEINFKKHLSLKNIADPDLFHGILSCCDEIKEVELGSIQISKSYQLVYCFEK